MAEQRADTTIDEELLEFLEADGLEEIADPAFKERLREALRAQLRSQREARERAPGPRPVQRLQR